MSIALLCGALSIVSMAMFLLRELSSNIQIKPPIFSTATLREIVFHWIQSHSKYLRQSMTWRQRIELRQKLDIAGLTRWQPEDFVACQVLMLTFTLVFGCVIFIYFSRPTPGGIANSELLITGVLTICFGFGAYNLPNVWLHRVRFHSKRDLEQGLPMLLDLLAIGLSAGLNVSGAFKFSTESLTESGLKIQARGVLSQIQTGVPLSQALQNLAEQCSSDQLQQFASLVLQSETLGVSLSRILAEYAEHIRQDRYLLIEQHAMQAPVKMLLPLAICIFPCNFLVLGFPIVAQLFEWQ